MTEFFFNYGLFLTKTATIVAAIIVVVWFIVIMASRKQTGKRDLLEVKKLNKKYDDMAMAMNASMLQKDRLKKYLKEEKEKLKRKYKDKKKEGKKKRIFVLNFHGDIRASAVSSLR